MNHRITGIALAVLLVGGAVLRAAPIGDPSGKPFENIAADMDDLQAQIDALRADLNAETSARMAADTALGDAIAAEESARTAADAALAADIAAEEAARAAADAALEDAIAAEESARTAADAALAADIAAEEAARTAADADLQSDVDGLAGQVGDLAGLVEALTVENATQQDEIDELRERLSDMPVWQKRSSGELDNWASSSYASILTDTIVAPRDGTLLIWGVGNAEWDIDSAADSWAVVYLNIGVGGSAVSNDSRFECMDSSKYDSESAAVVASIPVTAGTYTVELLARRVLGSAMVYWWDRSLYTLFLPGE